ncbi:MAG: hypothetical protein OEL77_06375 [Nitrosopumilus sp.]|nr:hypothetical protein [Nitrosopumilus sp.]MDH3385621.1 hypothetical protein [Nitrosopumilus sp.]
MKEPHNHAQVGYAMILVAASLTGIALIALAIGGDVLYGDNIQRDHTAHFNECKNNDFKTEGCEKYHGRINSEISGIYVDLEE